MSVQIDYKNIFYPPGGILIWIIILLELFTFGVALIAMAYYGGQEPELFHESKMHLNIALGTANTVILLTSGFFMANTVHFLRQHKKQKALRYLLFTMLFGIFFIVLKTFEYQSKIDAGLLLGTNTFFNFYWLLTLFHVIHVIVGLVILATIYIGVRKKDSKTQMVDVEASAAFWHMCDLIWLLLFPIVYLIF